jgi:hypothetical protein
VQKGSRVMLPLVTMQELLVPESEPF